MHSGGHPCHWTRGTVGVASLLLWLDVTQELCAGKGLDVVPKLAFEKWRFAAKFEEERAAFSALSAEKAAGKGGKGKKPKGAIQAHLDPLIPGLQQSNSSDKQRPEPGLVADLVMRPMLCLMHTVTSCAQSRGQFSQILLGCAGPGWDGDGGCGGDRPRACSRVQGGRQRGNLPPPPPPPQKGCQREVWLWLVMEDIGRGSMSLEIKLELLLLVACLVAELRQVAALGHKLASGRAPMEESQLPFLSGHNHSLDMQCRGHFVKLTFSAFEKLQLLYSRHAPLADGDGQEPVQVPLPGHPLPPSLIPFPAEISPSRDLTSPVVASQAPAPGAHCSPSTFSSRAFALLLRYKTIQVTRSSGQSTFSAHLRSPSVTESRQQRKDVVPWY